MDEAARLSTVIGNLYDASLDPALWSVVLGEARDFVGGSAAAIFAKDAAATTLTVFHHDGGIDPHYTQLYYERYMALDPSNTAHFFSTVETPISTSRLHRLRRIPRDPLLQGMGSAAGPGRFPDRGAREVDDDGGSLRHLPA